MEDNAIIDLYFARSDDAIAETARKYGKYAKSIAFNILKSDEDAEEALNDTYLRVWETIPPKKPKSLKAYISVICRSVSINAYEKNCAKKRTGKCAMSEVLDELSDCVDNAGDSLEALALREALNAFLLTLDGKTRMIFVRRYFYMNELNEIAHDFSMKKSAVAMTLSRTREKLHTYLEKEGFSV